jgi:hypothetical protein
MDMYCKHCGEPWEIDTLHDVVGEGAARNYQQAARLFAKLGCGIMMVPPLGSENKFSVCTAQMVDQEMADRSGVMQDMSPHPDEWMI